MKSLFTLTIIASLFWSLAAAAPQEGCSDCKASGLHACKSSECSARSCGTKLKHTCDHIYRAKCCQGFRHKLCDKCHAREAAKKLRDFNIQRRVWLKEAKKVDLRVGIRFAHVETEHFFIHDSHTEWRFAKKGKQARTRGAHIWAERVEEAAQDVISLFGPVQTMEEASKKHHLYLTWTQAENMAASKALGNPGSLTRYSFRFGDLGDVCQIYGFPDQESHYNDKGLHAFAYHHAAFSMIGRLAPRGQVPQWFGIGATHWLDLAKFKRAKKINEYSIGANLSFNSPWRIKASWPKLVAKRVKKDRTSLKKIIEKSKHETFQDQALCWSVVNFLMRKKNRANIKKLTKAFRAGQSTEKAIQSAYGMSFEKFEAAWRRDAQSGRK